LALLNGKHPDLAACLKGLATLAEADREPLCAILTAWPEPPEPVKAGIVAMVKASTLGTQGANDGR
jgi:hypothetical protein